MIEDFFRLLIDALLYYPYKLISSALLPPIFSAALTALTLEQTEPLIPTLHYLRDFIAYGGSNPPRSIESDNPVVIQQTVQKIVLAQGEMLVQRLLTGMMFSLPRDCFPDASGVLLELLQLMPTQTSTWIATTIQMLPAGTVSPAEATKLMTQMNQYVLSSLCFILLQLITNMA